MNDRQRQALQDITWFLRRIAEPIGPLHSYWDVIFEIEARLDGRESKHTINELIEIGQFYHYCYIEKAAARINTGAD